MTTVVLSPHLDDAIFSIPAWMRSVHDHGEKVVVLSVFTEGDERHAARREEDRIAASVVGATAIHLGLQDAPFRRNIGETFRDLIFTDLSDRDSDAEHVATTLFDRVAQLQPKRLIFPLGVGNHIDHRIVHRAHHRFASNVWFYEERPYSMIRHAVRARVASLGATVDGIAFEGSNEAAAEFIDDAAQAPYIRSFLPASERIDSLSKLASALTSPSSPSGLHLRENRLIFDEDRFALAIGTMQTYASQINALFDLHNLATALRPIGTRYEERIYQRA